LEERIVGKNLFESRIVRKDVSNAAALTTDARTVSAVAVFDGDSFEPIQRACFTSLPVERDEF
jgi:hypothetical protein